MTPSETAPDAAMLALAVMAALLVKHFICDFALQTNYQAQNKGRYGHPAGLLHVALHGAGSTLALAVLGLSLSFIAPLVVVEMVIHYHIDWGKQAVSTRAGWTPADRLFWISMGADQLLHQLTYVVMAIAAVNPGWFGL